FSQQWSTSGNLAYGRIEYVDTPRLDTTWVADATLSYAIWRNMSLVWDYQYSSTISNAPFQSFKRNLVTMSATYKF
ncbi:MAG: outer membrane beta-barrel protein, partial [Alphaproteobacteria bacterium]|nr:outer membrane beta-barrel protein [Alphaproteobacteria bacterium]